MGAGRARWQGRAQAQAGDRGRKKEAKKKAKKRGADAESAAAALLRRAVALPLPSADDVEAAWRQIANAARADEPPPRPAPAPEPPGRVPEKAPAVPAGEQKDRLRRRQAAAAARQGGSVPTLGAKMLPDLGALFGSARAADAIFEAAEVELWESFVAKDPADTDARADLDQKLMPRYKAALSELALTLPNLVCCDQFESGGCAHGKLCECGWLQAPWPWIVYRPDGMFCDCHMEDRELWQSAAGRRYLGEDVASKLHPDCGPHNGRPAQVCEPVRPRARARCSCTA